MAQWIHLDTSNGHEALVDIDNVSHAKYAYYAHEYKNILTLISREGADMPSHFACLKTAFNKVAECSDFFRLDGEYQKGSDASYLIRPDQVDYIISSEPYDRDGTMKRGIILTGEHLWIDGLEVTQTQYQDLISHWRKAKGEGNVLHVLPDVASARFVKPGEVFIDPREVLSVESGQSGDTSVDVYFKKTTACLDFSLNKAVVEAANSAALKEIESVWDQMAGKTDDKNWTHRIRDRYMHDAARKFLDKLVQKMPQLISIPVHRGTISHEPSSISSVSKHDRGVTLWLKKTNAPNRQENKTIFMDKTKPAEIDRAYHDILKALDAHVTGSASHPTPKKP